MRVPVAGVPCNTVLGDLAGSWIRPPHWSNDRDFNPTFPVHRTGERQFPEASGIMRLAWCFR